MSPAEIAQLSRPLIQPPNGPPPTRLVIKELKRGSGDRASAGDEVTVAFAGADYRTGVERWASRGHLDPFTFQLGGGAVMPGWERGLTGMRVGGRRELVLPSKLASGEGARIYLVDLLAVHHQTKTPIAIGASDGPQDPGKPSVRIPNRTASNRLLVEELRKGSGRAVEAPAEVTVKYIGIDYKTGLAFFNAWGPDRVSRLSLEDPRNVWAIGISGMRVGGRRRLIVPARLAYGSGALIYTVELLSIARVEILARRAR